MILTFLLWRTWRQQHPGESFLEQFGMVDRLVYFFFFITTLGIVAILTVLIVKK